jgi:hypothetical protein
MNNLLISNNNFMKNIKNKDINIFNKIIKIEILYKAIDKFDSEVSNYQNKLNMINKDIFD